LAPAVAVAAPESKLLVPSTSARAAATSGAFAALVPGVAFDGDPVVDDVLVDVFCATTVVGGATVPAT
jgi:hypothetical protein